MMGRKVTSVIEHGRLGSQSETEGKYKNRTVLTEVDCHKSAPSSNQVVRVPWPRRTRPRCDPARLHEAPEREIGCVEIAHGDGAGGAIFRRSVIQRFAGTLRLRGVWRGNFRRDRTRMRRWSRRTSLNAGMII